MTGSISPRNEHLAITDHLPIRDHDPLLPLDALAAHGAIVLNPAEAPHLEGQARLRSTAYVASRLIFSADVDPAEVMPAIEEAADRFNYRVDRLDVDEAFTSRPTTSRFVNAFTFRPARPEPTPPPDAFRILQWARSLARDYEHDRPLRGVGLDHLLFANPGVIRRRRYRSAEPSASGEGMATDGLGTGVDDAILDYGRPGSGGRHAVAWLGPSPRRHATGEMPVRRPTVAVLDNGCGSHPWLDPVVTRGAALDGMRVGLSDPEVDPETDGHLIGGEVNYYEDALAGHGTFMAGLVHLFCPVADILAVRVLNADGIVSELDLVTALSEIHELARRHAHGEVGGVPIDLVVLSMGYYHETADDADDSALARVLRSLGDLGVLVVTAAGNDATARPMYPAALAPAPHSVVSSSTVPVLCAGALNPEGGAALFSNMGPWVTSWEPGASLVSTMPVTFRSGFGPRSGFPPPATPGERRALDPDDYQSGFAVWSGTSFAAPVLAGKLAAFLVDQSEPVSSPPQGVSDIGRSVQRAWAAISRCTPLSPT